MDDTGIYLEKISYFSRLLRQEGIVLTPRDTADAAAILMNVGMADREKVKAALRTVFARSREEQELFDRVFDGFFVSEEAMRRQAQEQARQQLEMEQARQEAEESLDNISLNESQLDTYVKMPAKERDRLRQFMDRYKDNMERNPELYSNFIHSVFAKTLLEQQMRMEDAAMGAQAADPELGILFRDISAFRDVEIPKAISIIQTISRQVNGELSAKRNRRGNGGKLDFRRTIRKGLETGGSLYRLKYKNKHNRRHHLVILCDVSGSMIQFSEFALRFIQSLDQVAESSRVFLFSEELVEADKFSLQNMDLFRSYVKDSGVYGRGTDLGSALQRLCGRSPSVLNGATILLILSDTKTIDLPRAAEAALMAKRMAGRMIWLNPIPQNHWPHVRSIQTFSNICSMVACNTLEALAAACRKLVIT